MTHQLGLSDSQYLQQVPNYLFGSTYWTSQKVCLVFLYNGSNSA